MITFLAVPSLPQNFVLGVDFFKVFGLTLWHDKTDWSCKEVCEINICDSGFKDYHELEIDDKVKLDACIEKFKNRCTGRLGRTNALTHKIETSDHEPINVKHYPVSPKVQERIRTEIDRMLSLDAIEPSNSPWCLPVVLVKKSNGRDRLCLDSRRLNTITKRSAYPLPSISSILDSLGKAKFITSLDLKDGFWQIPLTEDSKEKTAFCAPGVGFFQFKVLPFGLHNAAQTMQRLMNILFKTEVFEGKVFVYLDDIVIVTETYSEHIRILELVRCKMEKANITINLEKSKFCRKSLKYLGFVIDKDGLRTDPEKVEVVVNYPKPKTYREMKRFLGLTSWYRKFIKNFAGIAAPLHDLTVGKSKYNVLKWNTESESAFNELKNCLVSAPVLAIPDFTQPFSIHCDASNFALGAVLTQEIEGESHPIAYVSRKLRGGEVNYHTTEKECLAVVFALDKFRPYIEGYKFKVYTDHNALIWLFRKENLENRLARWVAKISQHDFETFYTKGKSNTVPDVLSRIPEICLISFDVQPEDEWYLKMLSKVALSPIRFKNWKIEDGKLYLKFEPKNYRQSLNEWKLVVPKSARADVLNECHDDSKSGHFGIFKSKERVLQRYYWPGVSLDVAKYVKECIRCKSTKTSCQPKQGLMGKFKSVSQPWQMIALDLMGPFPRSSSGNTMLLVICDWFTKFVVLHPLRQATSKKVAEILEKKVFLEYGIPQIVIADNGQQFRGNEFKKLLSKYGIEKMWYNSRYTPQNNFTERANKTIGNALRAYVGDNHRKWDVELPNIQVALRTAVSESTTYTPFFLNYGREFPFSSSDFKTIATIEDLDKIQVRSDFLNKLQIVYKDVSEKIKIAYNKNKSYYDKNRRPVSFNVGDKVLRRNYVNSDASKYFMAKLADKYVPAVIVEKISDLIYKLEDEHGKNIDNWHVKDIIT